jgi:hypothetical protein
MTRKYLFGPVTRDFAEQNLAPARQSGDCLAFNEAGDLDVTVRATNPWVLKGFAQGALGSLNGSFTNREG